MGNSGRDTAVQSRNFYMKFFVVGRQALKYARFDTMTRENGDSETAFHVQTHPYYRSKILSEFRMDAFGNFITVYDNRGVKFVRKIKKRRNKNRDHEARSK